MITKSYGPSRKKGYSEAVSEHWSLIPCVSGEGYPTIAEMVQRAQEEYPGVSHDQLELAVVPCCWNNPECKRVKIGFRMHFPKIQNIETSNHLSMEARLFPEYPP
jgi:hypothetical protein